MTILLDEIICANNNVNGRILDIIENALIYTNRKKDRAKTREYLEYINQNNLWHFVQVELIFFKNSLNNCCFFNHSKENVKQFVKNLEHISNGETNKIVNIPINYKKLMRIYEESSTYSLIWSGKKESILKVLQPVKKHIRKLEMEILDDRYDFSYKKNQRS